MRIVLSRKGFDSTAGGPRMLLTDTQINTVAKSYISDENFGGTGGELNMWKFYNSTRPPSVTASLMMAFFQLWGCSSV